MSKEDRRRYLTHDCDQARVEMMVQPSGNGDWYVSIVREGQGFNRLAPETDDEVMGPPAAVRIVTSGERREHSQVAAAVAALWRALGGEQVGVNWSFDMIRERDDALAEVKVLRARVAELELSLRERATRPETPASVRATLEAHEDTAHRWCAFIFRDGGQMPSTFGVFDKEEDARRAFGFWSTQWSESYLCKIVEGPKAYGVSEGDRVIDISDHEWSKPDVYGPGHSEPISDLIPALVEAMRVATKGPAMAALPNESMAEHMMRLDKARVLGVIERIVRFGLEEIMPSVPIMPTVRDVVDRIAQGELAAKQHHEALGTECTRDDERTFAATAAYAMFRARLNNWRKRFTLMLHEQRRVQMGASPAAPQDP